MFTTAIFSFFKNSKFYIYLAIVSLSFFIVIIFIFQDDIRSFFHIQTKQSLAVALSQQKDQQQKVIEANQKITEDFKTLGFLNNINMSSLAKLNDDTKKAESANVVSKEKLDKEIKQIRVKEKQVKPIIRHEVVKKPHVSEQAKVVIDSIWESYCDVSSKTCSSS